MPVNSKKIYLETMYMKRYAVFFCLTAMRNKICYQTIGKAISAGFKTQNLQAHFQALSGRGLRCFKIFSCYFKYTILLLLQMFMKPLRTRRILQMYNLFLTHMRFSKKLQQKWTSKNINVVVLKIDFICPWFASYWP